MTSISEKFIILSNGGTNSGAEFIKAQPQHSLISCKQNQNNSNYSAKQPFPSFKSLTPSSSWMSGSRQFQLGSEWNRAL